MTKTNTTKMLLGTTLAAGALALGLYALPAMAQNDMGGAAGGSMDAPTTKPMAAEKDVVDTAVAAGQFNTLAAALKAAGLVETLKGDGPFTVFAPTDEAFAKLPPGTLEMLLKPENKDQLKSILLYHVVPGKVTAEKVMTMDQAKTADDGKALKIKTEDGKCMVGDATVTKTDIMCSNGVIHVIDTVLMPPKGDM